jgi:hypothetical protein
MPFEHDHAIQSKIKNGGRQEFAITSTGSTMIREFAEIRTDERRNSRMSDVDSISYPDYGLGVSVEQRQVFHLT